MSDAPSAPLFWGLAIVGLLLSLVTAAALFVAVERPRSLDAAVTSGDEAPRRGRRRAPEPITTPLLAVPLRPRTPRADRRARAAGQATVAEAATAVNAAPGDALGAVPGAVVAAWAVDAVADRITGDQEVRATEAAVNPPVAASSAGGEQTPAAPHIVRETVAEKKRQKSPTPRKRASELKAPPRDPATITSGQRSPEKKAASGERAGGDGVGGISQRATGPMPQRPARPQRGRTVTLPSGAMVVVDSTPKPRAQHKPRLPT